MKRFLSRIVHNWPLKLGAVALASLMYGGLALSQNTQTYPGVIPVRPVNQPSNTFLLTPPAQVTSVRYFAPNGVPVAANSFVATVDLSGVEANGEFVTVRIEVKPLDERIRVLGYDPALTSVQLDPIVDKEVPVKVLRAGSEKVMQVTVDQLTDKSAKAEQPAVAKADSGSLGIVAGAPSGAERQSSKLADGTGVIVREVRPGSPAEQADLESGDAILAVNNHTIHSAEELKAAIKEAPDDKPLAMLIVREDKTQFIAITKTK